MQKKSLALGTAFVVALILFAFSFAKAQTESNTKLDFTTLKYNNPGLEVDLGIGLWASPIPIDFDNDGDMDLIVSAFGAPNKGLYLFENKSGDKMPVFAKPKRLGNSIKYLTVSYVDGKPRFTIPGFELTNFTKTFGKEKKPLFSADSILKDFKDASRAPRYHQWNLVDYDNDGDLDILIGIDDWTAYGWDNAYDKAGNWINGPLHGYVYYVENKNGNYVNHGRLKANGKDIDVYGSPSPNFADFDGDGDLDIICGEFIDKFTWFENIGTRQKPVYANGKYLQNANGLIKMNLEMMVPVAIDWNKDGFTDLIVGEEDGGVAFIENTGQKKDKMPVFKSPTYFKQQADEVRFGVLLTPFVIDWDNDGDEDIITGNTAGYIAIFENLGQKNDMPIWAAPKLLESNGKPIHIVAGINGSIQGPAEAKWGYPIFSITDWDGDQLPDLIMNSIWGKVVWYKNIGTKKEPKLAEPIAVKVEWEGNTTPKPAWIWWAPEPKTLISQWRTTPYAIDWNKDGLTDLIMMDTEGYLSFFERFKKDQQLLLKPGKRIFEGKDYAGYDKSHVLVDSLPGTLRLNNAIAGASGRRKFTITDWDGDGKPDFLVNSTNITFMKNEGVKNGFVQLSNQGLVAKKVLAGHDTCPAIADFNKDGIPDLLVGAEDGHLYYLENPRSKKK